jgi:Endonuclease/Exonuclease/phosphatase family
MRRTTTLAMRRTTLLIAAMVAAVLLASGAAFSQSTPVGDGDSSSVSQGHCNDEPRASVPTLPVMTRNLYLGADLDPVVEAAGTGNADAIVVAVSNAWTTIVGTDFPARAEALAKEIEQSHPMLVGLQEVSLYRIGPPDSGTSAPTPAEEVKYDYLEILLGELNAQGLHYAPIVVSQNYDAEFPGDAKPEVPDPVLEPQDIRDIRLTDRDVILARTDLPKSELKISKVQSANFANNASFPIRDTGSFTLSRGWASVDAKVEDGTFRFINTHLEQEGPFSSFQVLQGNELLSGPANTNLPVILAGDFNSRAGGDGTPTYSNLIGAGFKDAWSVTHPEELGNTWGHDEDLLNNRVNLTQRLDLVLFRDGNVGGLCASDADIVGDELRDRIRPSGLWPSDHAGVVATLRGE